MSEIIMDIKGMHCGGCATGIQMVTEMMDEVDSSFVDLEKEQGKFNINDESAKDKIIEEITKLGYTATVVAGEAAEPATE